MTQWTGIVMKRRIQVKVLFYTSFQFLSQFSETETTGWRASKRLAANILADVSCSDLLPFQNTKLPDWPSSPPGNPGTLHWITLSSRYLDIFVETCRRRIVGMAGISLKLEWKSVCCRSRRHWLCCRLRLIRQNSLCSSVRHKGDDDMLSRDIIFPLTGALYITIPSTTRCPSITNTENIWEPIPLCQNQLFKGVEGASVSDLSKKFLPTQKGEIVWVNHFPRNDLGNFQNHIVRIDQTSDDWCPRQ